MSKIKNVTIFDFNRFSKDVKDKRKSKIKDSTIMQVAKEIGIARATLLHIENKRCPNIESFARLCKYFKLDINDYFNF